MPSDVGILLRGKSLEKLPQIADKFDDCYIVNTFDQEIDMFEKHIKDKNIIHFVNSMTDVILPAEQYKKFNIDKIHFSFTKNMYTRKINIVDMYRKRGIKEINFLDDKYEKITRGISNTGVCCIFYVSEFIKPKRIWVVGLEFYHENYLIKKNLPHQLKKHKKIDMVGSFVNIVKKYPHIEYNLITYYEKLPELANLNILEV